MIITQLYVFISIFLMIGFLIDLSGDKVKSFQDLPLLAKIILSLIALFLSPVLIPIIFGMKIRAFKIN